MLSQFYVLKRVELGNKKLNLLNWGLNFGWALPHFWKSLSLKLDSHHVTLK